jgi:hypothetical protein
VDPDSSTWFSIRSENQIPWRPSTKSSMSWQDGGVDAVGSLVSAWWLLKPPPSSAIHNQEPKVNAVPSSSTTLVKLNDTIEFSGGCSMNAPTWRASCRCFTTTPTEGYPRGGEFVGRVSPRSGLEGIRNTRFRQVRTTESVIPYVLCGLYCLMW